jgi:hypothetical protein
MDWLKVAKLVRMLSSPNDGEVINAARCLARLGIHKIAARLEAPEVLAVLRAKPRGRLRCRVCGIRFNARSDAKTCLAVCRIKYHRQGKS